MSFEEKVLQAYSQKVSEIAEYLSQDEGIRSFFNSPTKEEIVAKLNELSLRAFDDGGVISYCNHEFDNVHIIDVEFSGVLEKYHEVGING